MEQWKIDFIRDIEAKIQEALEDCQSNPFDADDLRILLREALALLDEFEEEEEKEEKEDQRF